MRRPSIVRKGPISAPLGLGYAQFVETDISYIRNLKPPSYPKKPPDSSKNGLKDRDSCLSGHFNVPILPQPCRAGSTRRNFGGRTEVRNTRPT